MGKEPLYPNAKKITEIDFLSSSQECDYIQYLANLGIGSAFKEIDIIDKLFLRREIEGKDILFLKNKYLYLYGEGAMYYLQATCSMDDEKEKLEQLEIDELVNFLERFIQSEKIPLTKKTIKLVSLGSADAEKEIKALHKIVSRKASRVPVQFIPVDVSTPLLQLAVLKFNNLFAENNNVTIRPLLSDFWSIAKSTENFSFNQSDGSPVIFTLLGATIGNYKEEALLTQIIKFMKDGDYLILGMDLLPRPTSEESKQDIFNLYNTLGNIQFMLNPLSYIPKYRGYVSSFDKYFKLDKKNAIVFSEKPEYSTITDVGGAICYAPKLEIPGENNESMEILLAQSTKYDLDIFSEWIKAFKLTDLENKKTFRFEVIYSNVDKTRTKCFIVLQRQTINDETPSEELRIPGK